MEIHGFSQWVLAFGALVAIAGTWAEIVDISLARYVEKLYIIVLAEITLSAFKAGKNVYWDDMRGWYEAELPGGNLSSREAREALAQAERILPMGTHEGVHWENALATTRSRIPESSYEVRGYGCTAGLMVCLIASMFGLLGGMLSEAPSAVGISFSIIVLVISTIIVSECLGTIKMAFRGRARVRHLRRSRICQGPAAT